jgi:hypothetical protein
MKPIKILGRTALAALTAMVFVGPSPAMAETTALCKADENPCAVGNKITIIHETTLAGSPAVFLNSVSNITCDVLFLGSTVSSLGIPLEINGNFTYSNCLRGGSEKCTFSEKNGPSNVVVLREGHETAKVTWVGEMNMKCGSFINCTYDDEGLIGTAKGPLLSSETNGGILLDEEVVHKVSGFLCPSEAKLDITTTPLSATYISS